MLDHVPNGYLKVRKTLNRNFVQKAMCFIEKENGKVIQDSYALMKDARCFYENLHASRENEIVNLEIGNLINTPTLNDEEGNSLEGLITKQETQHSKNKQKQNKTKNKTTTTTTTNLTDKSPGSEGYTTDFSNYFLGRFRQSYGPLC